MLYTNKLKEKMKQGEIALGCQLRSRSSLIAELYGYCGFDYIFIENEHFLYNFETVEEIVRACEISGIEPILRIPDRDPAKILQYLDMGVKGLLFPHVDTKEDAYSIVQAGKYKPAGNRGFSNTSRATQFGMIPMAKYKEMANENTMLIPFVESREAVENIDEILKSGIDAIHLGPGDLSESYNGSGEAVQIAIDYVISHAKKAQIPVICVAANVDDAVRYVERGVSMISFSSDLMLLQEICKKSVDSFYKRIDR